MTIVTMNEKELANIPANSFSYVNSLRMSAVALAVAGFHSRYAFLSCPIPAS
jgi:hypothetical protein